LSCLSPAGSPIPNETALRQYTSPSAQAYSAKSNVKQPVRPSNRKHVTFKDTKHSKVFLHLPDSPGSDVTSANLNSSPALQDSAYQQLVDTFVDNIHGEEGWGSNAQNHNDNNYLRLDNNNCNNSRNEFNKNSPRTTLSTFNYANKINMDFSGHQVYPST
jgi:hypothetical protein